MKHKTSQILYAYWNDVRADRAAPRRFDIEPARIASILPETFILERFDSQTYRFRLAGTRICEQFGREFRGTNFLDPWSDADAITLERLFGAICEQAGVGIIDFSAATVDGRKVDFEAVLLPLVHTRPQVSRFLGAMSAAQSPVWLGSERLMSHRLARNEVIWPDGRPHAAIKSMQQQSPFLSNVRGARLVKQDRRQFRVYEGGLSKPDSEPN